MALFSYEILSTEPLRVRSSAGEEEFSREVLQPGSKVYVVSNRGQIVYVGSTRQSVRSRLSGAFRATGQNGYYGPAWKTSTAALSLDVWILDGVVGEKSKRCMIAETVEAEVVFLVRQRDGNWPAHQTEIHFHPSNAQHRRIAESIYDEIRKRV
jgi:hypothetical protein